MHGDVFLFGLWGREFGADIRQGKLGSLVMRVPVGYTCYMLVRSIVGIALRTFRRERMPPGL